MAWKPSPRGARIPPHGISRGGRSCQNPPRLTRTLGMLLKPMQNLYICTKNTGLAALTIPELPPNRAHGASFAQTAEKQQGRERYAGKD